MKIRSALGSGSTHWFEQILNEEQLKREREYQPEHQENNLKHFRPSMVHACPRALWYARKGTEAAAIKPQSLRRMGIGTLLHEFIEDLVKSTSTYHSSEQEVVYDDGYIRMVGHYDLILVNPSGGYELVELKSYADPAGRYKLNLPREEHIGQWNLYSFLTSVNDHVPDVDSGFIFYFNKNTQEYKIYQQKRNILRISNLLKKLNRVQDYLTMDKIYPYQPDENHNWCGFKSVCERDYFLKGI